MGTTPVWQAAENGVPNNEDAVNASSHVNQLLGTHAFTPVYEGVRIVTPIGGTGFGQVAPGNGRDFSQPFVMPGGKTVVGRVSLPLAYSGAGADALVSLCPDLSGAPDTANPIAATLVPADWLTAFTAPNGLPTGGPLAAAQFGNLGPSTNINVVSWASPTVDSSGTSLTAASVTSSGNYFILAGGFTTVPVNNVATARFSGSGVLETMVAQPPVPQATFFATISATTGSLVYAGGNSNLSGSTLTANVYTASWDSSTGTVGAWSLQTPLPVALQHAGGAAFGDTVYVVGGLDGSNNLQTAVYYAGVNNGQLSAWHTGPPLPVALQQMSVSAVAGWLIVAGGSTTAPSNTPTGSVLYAKIQSDGSLGPWLTGPSLPVPMFIFSSGWDTAVTDSSVILVGGQTSSTPTYTSNIQSLMVTANGVGDYWKQTTWSGSGVFMATAFPVGNGRWDMFTPVVGSNFYEYTIMTPMPLVSVPLAASGLTPGNTYHVVIQQNQNPDQSDFYSVGFGNGALPLDTLKSNRHSGVWTTSSPGFSIPMVVYDNTVGGTILHTWEDSTNLGSSGTINMASRTTTLLYGQNSMLLGVADTTLMPDNPIDVNSTFTSGVSNWTPVGCTFVQSNAQTHGGFPFSGLITPNGVTATVSVESNKGPVPTNPSTSNGQFWVQACGWVYSPTGYSSVSLSVNWYDSAGNYISTSSNSVTVPAAAWTFLNNFFLVPAPAAQATLVPTEGGTPAVGNTLYLSNITLTVAAESVDALSSVSTINYVGNGSYTPKSLTVIN